MRLSLSVIPLESPADTAWGLTPAGWAAVTAIATVITALTAIGAVCMARTQLGHSLDQLVEARKAQAEAERPYVVVTVEPAVATQLVMELVVRSMGRRPAFGVRISLDPPPQRTDEDQEGYRMAEAKMLSQPIGMLAPGQELRTTFDFIPDRLKTDLPSEYTATITYSDSSGHSYDETALLDLYVGQGTTHVVTYGIHDVAKSLREVKKTLKGASLLQRRGRLITDTSVESRVERSERTADEARVRRETHQDLLEVLKPNED